MPRDITIEGNFIRAWNNLDNGSKSIIDCIMNLPQLYFASDELNDDRFKAIAIKLFKAMEEKWCHFTDGEDSILQMGSE